VKDKNKVLAIPYHKPKSAIKVATFSPTQQNRKTSGNCDTERHCLSGMN